ncbi:MAG TPA: biotin-dependent carboxyltransferase family protein [Actinomycetota bacterium]|nr:biotin-dependent carboxyltransferase family protein [Actinomycetota bacterium]
MIEVVAPGALTTVQDLGRPGLGALGIAESGAMDPFALIAANRLVHNDDGAAGLEFTLVGPTLRFHADTRIAVTGSRFDATLDGEPCAHDATIDVHEGQILKVGTSREGARGYLAIAGGIDVVPVMHSRSRHVAADFGSPAVARTMRLPLGAASRGPHRRVLAGAYHRYARERAVRFVRGPQWGAFDDQARTVFANEPFVVSTRSDRSGIRLTGPALRASEHEIDPEGVPAGAVQVPGSGEPIVLGPDRPITGGYPKIAVAITADLAALAQAKPGDTLRFVETTVEEARAALALRRHALDDGIEDMT